MAPCDVTESESDPAVELTVRSLREAEEVADGTYRWARARFVVDVPGIDNLGDAAMVLARLLPLMLREGWVVYSTRLLTEADLLFESLNELWWEVADVVECVHAAVDHLRRSGMGAGTVPAEEVDDDHLAVGARRRRCGSSSSQDGDGGEGAEAGAAAAEEMDGEVGVAAEAAARRCSSPDGVGEGARVSAEEIVDGETAPDHAALASAALRRARDGMREVTAAATAEALQFALDEMGDDDNARAKKAALTSALLSMRTRLGKHCGLALFTSNMNNCRDMAVLGHDLNKATGVLLPLRSSSKESESDAAEQRTSSGAEAAAQTPASSEPRDQEITTESRIAHLERLISAASPLLDVIDHMRKAAVSFDLPASARAPPPPSSTDAGKKAEDDEED